MQEQEDNIKMYLAVADESMQHSISHLHNELMKVRTGKASPALVNGLLVAYYGSETPLNQVANVSVVDSRTITIQPWEKTMIQPIEKAIFEANLGVTPQNDGELVRISIPPLTEERRKDLVKMAKAMGEDAKVSIRNARRDAMGEIKQAVKEGYPEDSGRDAEASVQQLTDKFSEQVDTIIKNKETDILTI
jgi:ribosome recycling factor